jgi:CBS domain-containing protein
MSCVKDYMMRTLNSVHYEDTIFHVIEFMHKTEMMVFPVVDDENQFMGTFRANSILKNIIPEQFGHIETHMLLHDVNLVAENMLELKDKKLLEYMTKTTDVVREDDDMDSIASIMLKNEEAYVFVVNDQKNFAATFQGQIFCFICSAKAGISCQFINQ